MRDDAALLCGRAGLVPPIAGLERPDPLAASLNLARTAVAATGPIALVIGFVDVIAVRRQQRTAPGHSRRKPDRETWRRADKALSSARRGSRPAAGFARARATTAAVRRRDPRHMR
jgi:hypothetical protein